jgi:uncharacterized membrane protein YdbT with pleckstrin-like domain
MVIARKVWTGADGARKRRLQRRPLRRILPPVAPKLGPGETILFEGHPSWRSILAFYVKGIAVTAVVCAVVAFVSGLGEGGADTGLVTVVALVGVGLTVLVGFIKRVATSYTITNRRLHIKRGIISRTIQETRLERVQNVNYHQNVLQRLLQVGDVDFDTAAGDDYNFVFGGVAQPEQVVHQVDQATRRFGDDAVSGEPEPSTGAAPPQR